MTRGPSAPKERDGSRGLALTTPSVIANRLETCIARRHMKVAVRYYLMGCFLGVALERRLVEAAEAAMHVCGDNRVRFIQDQVVDWIHSVAKPSLLDSRGNIAYAALAEEALRLLAVPQENRSPALLRNPQDINEVLAA